MARAIKAGRLSATRTDIGSYQIDPAELARVYPFPAPTEVTGATVAATGQTPNGTAVLEAQIVGLREVGDLLRRQLDDRDHQLADLREDRDHWRTQAEAAQRLLTGRPWWRRIAGK